ncbi:MAG TPA: hypothetical protein VJZ26_14705 [Blastocatellia bacterium]|nr:hypothetical protein [Blastocatellia bacterium]
MVTSKGKFRAAISSALALVLASVFALSSFAASNARQPASRETAASSLDDLSSAPAGKLTGTGRFTIDGEEAQSGASVLSGSTVATGPGSLATIDLGSLGRIELRPNTTIRLAFAGNAVSVSLDNAGSIAQSLPAGVTGQVMLQGKRAKVSVARGEVAVTSIGNSRMLRTGEESMFENAAEVTSRGEAVFLASGSESYNKEGGPVPSHGTTVSAGVVGAIAMAGVATAVSLGVIYGGDHHSTGGIPPRPSQIVP